MTTYTCEYCGHQTSLVFALTASSCQRHPDGPGRGRHKLYEGSSKKSYSCKYCGHPGYSIFSLTSGSCQRHPLGAGKGRHAPAL